MDSTHERNCPECGGRLIWVVYGYPDHALAEAARRGDVDLGGCCVGHTGTAVEGSAVLWLPVVADGRTRLRLPYVTTADEFQQ